jgi:hypothetical protein
MEIDQAVAHAVGLVEPDAVLVVHPLLRSHVAYHGRNVVGLGGRDFP